MSDRTVRAAVVQAGSVYGDTPATLAKLDRLVGEAAGQGVQLAVFPEAFVGGYPKHVDLGARVGTRSAEGRDFFRDYAACAIDIPGPDLEAMRATAKANAIALVVGVIERDGGTLYCTAVFIGRDGTYLGKHRKLMPTAMERLIWGFGDGSTLPVIEMEGLGKVGAAICWENQMPLLRAWMYSQGVELYCAPTVDDRPQWQSTMRHIAYEGRCFVLAACQYATRADYPADYPFNPEGGAATVMIGGGSVIVSPFGEVLAGPMPPGEGVLVADLDMGEIARGKFDLDVAGHYARPDVFDLIVDTRAKPSARVRED